MLTPKQIGKRILERRHRLGLTQDSLAAASGLSIETIRRLELGTINAHIATFGKVATGLRATASSLLADTISDEMNELVVGLPVHEQEIAFVMLRALSEHMAAQR